MRSVHFTNAWHATSGGIRTFYTALIEAAEREHRRVVVVVPGDADAIEDFGSHGRLHVLKAPQAPAFDRRYHLIYPHRYLPFTGRRVIEILRVERPDVVEVCDKYSLPYLAALLRKGLIPGVPRPGSIVGLSCERFDDNMAAYLTGSGTGRAFTRWYIRHIYGPPFDVHVANSEYTAGELREALHGRPSDFVRVCPMGVHTARFGPEHRSPDLRLEIRHTLGLGPATKLLLYAGRISPEKNIALLVDLLRVLERRRGHEYALVVAGDGPLARWLERQASGSLANRILLRGNLNRQQLAAHYASCDVFVHPNPREPFGIGPLEAMASGVPVVLPNAGGVLTYASPQNAWPADPTAEAFADAVADAVKAEPTKLVAARAAAVQFDWSRAASAYFSLHDELLSRARRDASTAGNVTDRNAAVSGPRSRDVPS